MPSREEGEISDCRIAEGWENREVGAFFRDRRDLMLNVFLGPFLQKTLTGFVLGCCLVLTPTVVQSFTAHSATVQWAANSESDLAGYKVYQGSTAGSYGPPIDVKNVTIYTASNLQVGLTYSFAITAYDLSGNESYPSDEVRKHIAVSSLNLTPPSLSLTSPTKGSSQNYKGETVERQETPSLLDLSPSE